MARPKPDVAEIRTQMMVAAEALLAESGGRRLMLTDVADRVGLSQSYAHRFFRTKADLVRALAERWFAEVEASGEKVVRSALPPEVKLRAFILEVLRHKRAKHDRDPVLFRAYLRLAEDHMDLVRRHTARLTGQLREIVAALVPPERVEATVDLIEDATVPFRVPMMIALFRDKATDARADGVVSALLESLRNQDQPPEDARKPVATR